MKRRSVVLVGLSGFLYVAIVVGWAVYLVPFALKRYDEAARNRSVDRFSSAMRVLGRREDEAAKPSASTAHADPVATPVGRASGRPAQDGPARRAAAKVAARRRRRILLMLLFATAATAVTAGLAVVAWWSVGIPGGLVVVWLLACRTQARRERAVRSAYADARGQGLAHDAAPADDGEEDGEEDGMPVRGGSGDTVQVGTMDTIGGSEMPADDEPTVVLQRDDLEEAGAAHPGQGSLWDPVPVTLPTYVNKPRAPRTIRTIDLGAAGVQTSGHTASSPVTAPPAGQSAQSGASADSRAAEEPAPESVEHAGPARRAVGE